MNIPGGREDIFNRARSLLDTAISLSPDKSDYLIARGELELSAGTYEECSISVKKAALLEAVNPYVQMRCSCILFRLALKEKRTAEKEILLKKAYLYYSIARDLSANRVSMRSILPADKYGPLIKMLADERIKIQ